jgi:general stress protein CsbA
MHLCMYGCMYVVVWSCNDVIYSGRALTKQEVTISFTCVSVLLCLLTGGFTFIKGVGFAAACNHASFSFFPCCLCLLFPSIVSSLHTNDCITVILAHCSFRERSLKSRGTAYVDVDLMYSLTITITITIAVTPLLLSSNSFINQYMRRGGTTPLGSVLKDDDSEVCNATDINDDVANL